MSYATIQRLSGLGEYCPPDPQYPGEEMHWYQGACRTDNQIAYLQGIRCTGTQKEFEGVCRTPEEIDEIKAERAKQGYAKGGGSASQPARGSVDQAAASSGGPSRTVLLVAGALGLSVIGGIWLAKNA